MLGRLNPFSSGTDDDGQTPTDEFDVEIDSVDLSADGKELLAYDAEGNVFAGAALRECIESDYAEKGRVPLGYQDRSDTGLRVAGIPVERSFQQFGISGITGSGKTVLLTSIGLVVINGGDGAMFIFPKGDGDSLEFVRRLPEDRLDDLIWIEPASEDFDRVVSLNLMARPEAESQVAFDKTLGRRIEAVKSLFDTSEYWGPTMEFIVETMAQSMILSEETYAPIDMPFLLATEDRREEFAATVDDPFIVDAVDRVCEMDFDEILPVWKRMAKHVASPTKRKILAERESTIDYDEIARENRIVVMRPPDAGNDMTQFLSLFHLDKLWEAKRRLSRETDGDPPRFHAICDESDKIFSDSLDIEDMFARARSANLALYAACQYAAQWSDEVKKAVKNNTKNKLALTVDDRDSAKFMMESFREHGPEDVLGMENYHVWAKIPHRGGGESEHRLQTFPPYPPLRSAEEAREVIRKNLETYGKPPLSDEEILDELPVGDAKELKEMIAAGRGAKTGEEAIDNATVNRVEVYRAFDDTCLALGKDAVTLEEAKPRLRDERYVGLGDAHHGVFEDLVDRLTTEHLEEHEADGEIRYSVATEMAGEFATSGTGGGSAKAEHRKTARWVREEFTKRNARVRIVTQGTDSDADVLIRPLVDLPDGPAGREKALETYRESHPILAEVSPNASLSTGEVEHSTGKTQAGQTVWNLVGAVEAGGTCLFAVKDIDTAESVYATLTDPPYVKRQEVDSGRIVREDLYLPADMTADGTLVWRPRTGRMTTIYKDYGKGTLVIADSAGEVFARLPINAMRGEGPTPEMFAGSECLISPRSKVDEDRYQTVPEPVDPDALGIADIEEDDGVWRIVIEETPDGPAFYSHGEVIPFSAVEEHGSLDAAREATESETPEDRRTGISVRWSK